MQSRQSWQRSAVALFTSATARLTEDARQLGEAMNWGKTLHTDAWRSHAQWLSPPRSSVVAEDR